LRVIAVVISFREGVAGRAAQRSAAAAPSRGARIFFPRSVGGCGPRFAAPIYFTPRVCATIRGYLKIIKDNVFYFFPGIFFVFFGIVECGRGAVAARSVGSAALPESNIVLKFGHWGSYLFIFRLAMVVGLLRG